MRTRTARPLRRADRALRFALGVSLLLIVMLLIAQVATSLLGFRGGVPRWIRNGIGLLFMCSIYGHILVRAVRHWRNV